MHSSSGGVFSELSKSVIATGGVVYGCVLDGLLKAVHVRANTIEQIAPMRGSKYVQSDLKNVYAMTRHDLDNGIQVLFTGTPCQILGLISFLNKPYDNLITVGLICHGVPSPELFEYYKRSEAKKVHDDLVNITFRDKHFSWREFAIALEFSNSNNNAYISQWSGSYMCLFNRNYLMRESCFHCPARTGMSGCDIVIGDFWGVEREHPELDSLKGYSCVLAYTPKGLRLIESSPMEMTETTYRKVIRANVNVEDNPRRPYGIEYFRMNYKLKPFDEWTDWVFWGPWWFRMLCPVLHWQEFKIRYVRTAYRWFRRLLLGDR